MSFAPSANALKLLVWNVFSQQMTHKSDDPPNRGASGGPTEGREGTRGVGAEAEDGLPEPQEAKRGDGVDGEVLDVVVPLLEPLRVQARPGGFGYT